MPKRNFACGESISDGIRSKVRREVAECLEAAHEVGGVICT